MGQVHARFNPQQFQSLVDEHGLEFLWSRALTCSCNLNDETDQPDPTCAVCQGDGWRYVHPYPYENPEATDDFAPVKGILSTAAQNPDIYHEGGEFYHGDALLTVDGLTRVGYRDRFISTEHEMAYYEVVERAATGQIVPVGHVGRTTTARRTALRYAPLAVNFVGDVTNTWLPGTDFLLREGVGDEAVKLEWVTGRGPAAGARYAIHYICRPVWLVEAGMFGIQNWKAPPAASGIIKVRPLPTPYKLRLDFITDQLG